MNSPDNITFDQLYSFICDKLKESNTLEHILIQITQPSDFDRIKLILGHDSDAVSLFVKNIVPQFEHKDQGKAQELLKEACSQNSVECINHALRLCCKSDAEFEDQFRVSEIRNQNNLQNYVKGSGTVSIPEPLISEIFARRAAILFLQGQFESCIRDTFRSSCFGGHKTYEMVLRLALSYKHLGLFAEAKVIAQHALEVLRSSSLDNEAKCKETIRLVGIIKEIHNTTVPSGKSTDRDKSDVDSPTVALKLFEAPHNELVGGSSAIKLVHTAAKGRHVLAKRNIPPGSTLIIEEAFAWSVSVKNYSRVCQYCMMSQPSDCVPCDQCSSVIFCNEECKEKALKLFHASECQIFKLLDSSEKLGQMAVLCFRTVAQVPLKEILQSHESLLTKCSDVTSVIMGYNKQGKLDSADYASVFAQTTNSGSRSGADLLKRTYASIYLTLCLRFVGYFGNNEVEESVGGELSKSEEIVASVLLRHLQSVSCNAYGVNQASQRVNSRGLEIEEVGGATYPLISSTNHSCNPNIYRFNIGRKCVVRTLHEIHEGEEILDSYGPSFTTAILKQRSQELRNQYLFQCDCNACRNNWLGFDVLRSSPRLYSCPYCATGKLDKVTAKDKRKCSECGKVVDFKKVQKHLKSAEDKFCRAKELIFKERLVEGYEGLHTCICNYIGTVQKVLVVPSKEMVEGQEVLKFLWNLAVRKNILK